MTNESQIAARAKEIQADWETNPRWDGVERDHSAEDVVRLQGSFVEDQTIARNMADKLWDLLTTQDYVHALGAMTGGQAVQMVRAGLKAIYLSGWQVAADANLSGAVYPDQSLTRPIPLRCLPRGSTTRSSGLMRSSGRKEKTHGLDGSDHRRRRERVRWCSERVRAYEEFHRGGCCSCPP